MCCELEELYEEVYREGIENGELKKAKETAIFMVMDGMKIDKIAKYIKESTETVQGWIDENLSVIH